MSSAKDSEPLLAGQNPLELNRRCRSRGNLLFQCGGRSYAQFGDRKSAWLPDDFRPSATDSHYRRCALGRSSLQRSNRQSAWFLAKRSRNRKSSLYKDLKWRRRGSNPQPPGCKPGALPIELRPRSESRPTRGPTLRSSEGWNPSRHVRHDIIGHADHLARPGRPSDDDFEEKLLNLE
jgi:hypothetical protein